jgi:hypothetical protein
LLSAETYPPQDVPNRPQNTAAAAQGATATI